MKLNSAIKGIFSSARPSATLCAAGAAMVLTAVTFTSAAAVPGPVKRACASDYKRLCPKYKPGTARMRNCMGSSVAQMSQRCYNKLKQYGYGSKGRGKR